MYILKPFQYRIATPF